MMHHKTTFKNHQYHWSGMTEAGKKIFGEMHSTSINAAKNNLKQKGIVVLSIRKNKKWLLKSIIHHKKISPLDIALFFRQLSTLIAAGIPIVQSCEMIANGQEKSQLQSLIISIKNELISGQPFTICLSKHKKYFDELTCRLIHVGEQTGTLETMLVRIASHKEKMLSLKNQVKQALFYPCIILSIAFIITIAMLTWIVPRFEDLFQSMHSQLPTFTAGVVGLSKIIREYAWLILAILFFSAGLFFYSLKNSSALQQFFDGSLFKIPILGPFRKKIHASHFARSLSTTLAAGVPITNALTLISSITKSHLFTNLLLQLQKNIAAGQQLHQALQIHSFFPLMMVQMIKVGEESGMLEQMLEKTADIYEADTNRLINYLSTLLEPLIMIILGVLIGGLVIAMYLPIFKLGTVI